MFESLPRLCPSANGGVITTQLSGPVCSVTVGQTLQSIPHCPLHSPQTSPWFDLSLRLLSLNQSAQDEDCGGSAQFSLVICLASSAANFIMVHILTHQSCTINYCCMLCKVWQCHWSVAVRACLLEQTKIMLAILSSTCSGSKTPIHFHHMSHDSQFSQTLLVESSIQKMNNCVRKYLLL